MARRLGRALVRRERIEEDGRRPDPLTRAVRRRPARSGCTWRGNLAPPWATSSLAGSPPPPGPEELADRVPPGQYIESGFPVLTAGPTPRVDTGEWSLKIDGMVSQPREWNWTQFHQLPQEDVPATSTA